MPLPASLLTLAESHGCFSGCYGVGDSVWVCTDPTHPADRVLDVHCEDCLLFKVGALARLLPPGMTSNLLAAELSAHMRQVRGYDLAFGGYHSSATGGFWLSAAYYGSCGVFLLSGDPSGLGSRRELDHLIMAFRNGVAQAPHPQMTDKRLYTTETVFLDLSKPLGPVTSKQSILGSPQCSRAPKGAARRVVLAEFLPVAQGVPVTSAATIPGHAARLSPSGSAQAAKAARSSRPAAAQSAASPRSRNIGDICSVCGEEVGVRQLFSSTYIGCRCG